MHLESILLSICALLDEPDVEDPLVPEIAVQYLQDKSRYEEIAREYTSRYACGDSPVLTVSETRRAPSHASWQSNFLKDRLEQTRARNTTLIQALDRQPQTHPNSSLSAEAARDYVNMLYKLSLELDVLSHAFDDPTRYDGLSTAQFEELQNFFDLCNGEFWALVDDEEWKPAFPNLPSFGSDATRGTGNSFTYSFQERKQVAGVIPFGEPIPVADSSAQEPDVVLTGSNPRLEGLKRAVKHAEWLNGDNSLGASDQARSLVGGVRVVTFLYRGYQKVEGPSIRLPLVGSNLFE